MHVLLWVSEKNRNYLRLVFKRSLRSKIKAVCGDHFLLSVRGEVPEIRPFVMFS